MGSLDYKHQEAHKRFKDKVRFDNPNCPNCKHELDHSFFQFHDEKDQLLVRIDFYCKGCDWSQQKVLSYRSCQIYT